MTQHVQTKTYVLLLGLAPAPELLELAPACTWLISAPLMVMVMVMMMICDDDDDDDGPTTYYHIYYLLHTLHLACQPLAIMGVPPCPEICVRCDAAYVLPASQGACCPAMWSRLGPYLRACLNLHARTLVGHVGP